MKTPARFKAETKYGQAQEKKANRNLPVMALVGRGAGAAGVTGRPAFYWIRLVADGNRVTQCRSLVPLTNDDIIYVKRARDRKLSFYEFVAFIQNAGGVTTPPIQTHDHGSATEGGTTIDATTFGGVANVNAVWTHTANLVLDDGAGDSPQLQFVGGSNNDTALMFLDDDAVAGQSDLIIRLPGNTNLSLVEFQDSGAGALFQIDGGGSARVPGGNFHIDAGFLNIHYTAADAFNAFVDDANNASVIEIGGYAHDLTAGVGLAGMGAGLGFYVTDGNGNLDQAATIEAVWDDPAHGSEDSRLQFLLRVAGAAVAEIARIDGDGLTTVAGTDLYPDADTAGLAERCINFGTDPCEDFRGAFGWLTTGWAGAPFDGTPDTVDFTTYPDFVHIGDGVTNDRFFRYRTIAYSLDDGADIVARVAGINDSKVGIRVDTGDDTDFTELYVETGSGTGLCDIVSRYQENGAGITTTVELDDVLDQYYMLRIGIAANNRLWVYFGIDTQELLAFTFRGDMDNWSTTATRVGIIYERTAGADTSPRRGFYDWFDTDLSPP